MKAFTLIELLVVVAIIGILAAVGVTTFGGFQEKAKVSTVKANFKMIEKLINTEKLKCEMDETLIFEGNIACAKNYQIKIA
jgi:type IV pilus assembly protein PilA